MLPALLLTYVASRLGLILLVPLAPTFDCVWYLDRGRDLSQGLGYAVGGVPTAFYPVGYPAFLGLLFSLFGVHVWVGQAANLVLGAGICLLIHRLSLAMLGNRGAALAAAALFVFYPNQLGYTLGLSTEVIYPFMILLAVLILARGCTVTRLLAFGLIVGLAALVKAQTLLFPLLPGALALCEGRSWRQVREGVRRVVLAAAAAMLVVLPWTARNYEVFGHLVPVSTNDGLDLLNANNPYANGDVTDDPRFAALAGGQTGATPAFEYDASRRSRDMALAWLEAHPMQALALVPQKIWRLWAIDGESEWAYRAGYPGYQRFIAVFHSLRWINQAYYTLMLLAGAGATILLWRRGLLLTGMVPAGLLMVAYTTLIAIPFSGQSRYHHFLMPWLAIYAGWMFAVGVMPEERRTSSPKPAAPQPAA